LRRLLDVADLVEEPGAQHDVAARPEERRHLLSQPRHRR